MTLTYRDAHEATSYDLHNLLGLVDALLELTTEHPALGTDDRTATAIIAVITAIEDRANAALEHHGAEWKAGKEA